MTGKTTNTVYTAIWCKHNRTFFKIIRFWVFKKQIQVCGECGRLLDPHWAGKETL